MSKVKCESRVDAGATRIRGWHDYIDCGRTAKYKITYKDGTVKYVCGIHKRKEEYLNQYSHYIEKIESMTPTNQTLSECRHYCQRLCLKDGRALDCRRTKHFNHCPDYQPKEKK